MPQYTFSEPETGRMPKAKDEIAASSLVLKDLGVPCRLGETFTLEIAVNQEIINIPLRWSDIGKEIRE